MRAVIVLAVSAGAFHVWSQGQVTWVLLYPFTRAWLALRDGRLISAGLWLAPVIVAKPIFVAVALFWPWRTWLMTGVASLMIALTGVAWLSLATWIAWLEGGSHVAWISYPLNASVWGLLARVQTGGLHEGTLSDVMAFSPILLVIIAGAAAAAAWRIARDRDADRRTTAGVLLMLLLSPLGWVYYLPIAFGPFVTTLPITRLTVTALALHLIPMVVFLPSMATTPVILQTIGSVYTIGLMLALLETIRRPRSVAASSPVSV